MNDVEEIIEPPVERVSPEIEYPCGVVRCSDVEIEEILTDPAAAESFLCESFCIAA